MNLKMLFAKERGRQMQSTGIQALFARHRLFSIVIGLVLVLYVVNAHAFYLGISAEPDVVYMQQGSSERIMVSYALDSSLPLKVYPYVDDFDGVELSANLSPITMQDSSVFEYAVQVARDAKPGVYNLKAGIKAFYNGAELKAEEVIAVYVSERQGSLYMTSPYSNIQPKITNARFSKPAILLTKSDSESTELTFLNTGSASDFNIAVASFQGKGIDVQIANPIAYNVCMNCEYTAYITVSTDEKSSAGDYAVQFAAFDIATGRQWNLGELNVGVKGSYDAEAFVPKVVYEVERGKDANSYLAVRNTGIDEISLAITTTSPLVELAYSRVSLLPEEEKHVPFTISADEGTGFGLRTARIYLNGEVARTVGFGIDVREKAIETETISAKQVIRNTTNKTLDDIHFVFTELPEGWKASVVPSNFSLAPDEEREIAIDVEKPKDAVGEVKFDIIASGEKYATVSMPVGYAGVGVLGENAFAVFLGVIAIIVVALIFRRRRGIKCAARHFIKGDREAEEANRKL